MTTGITTAGGLALFPALASLQELRCFSLNRSELGKGGNEVVTVITPTAAQVLAAQFRYLTQLTLLSLVGARMSDEAAVSIARNLPALVNLARLDWRGVEMPSTDTFPSLQSACSSHPECPALVMNFPYRIIDASALADFLPGSVFAHPCVKD